ncbi:hypothetical protein GDO78_019355 [Eleutherodactylus coqui]|uniref:Uncharacterized protein n=1 Tax=Eleutherodactylus coqui TaxID=57060 RepID=A0A8J6EJ56_ELECQ|nr:hypothetical protein GDO78_019355 [Eleutherodactylus coqui]
MAIFLALREEDLLLHHRRFACFARRSLRGREQKFLGFISTGYRSSPSQSLQIERQMPQHLKRPMLLHGRIMGKQMNKTETL